MARTDKAPRTRLDPDTRRAALLDAARAMFAERAYAEVTISAIATAAGASDALVYRYFGGKDDLYAAIVGAALEAMLAEQAEAVAALDAGQPARERVKVAVAVYLDHIQRDRLAWAGASGAAEALAPGARAGEPARAGLLRARAREELATRLRHLLAPNDQGRHEYAIWGFLGFLDGACGHWIARGCPEQERWPVIEAALGSLEGALGDWAA